MKYVLKTFPFLSKNNTEELRMLIGLFSDGYPIGLHDRRTKLFPFPVFVFSYQNQTLQKTFSQKG